MTAHDVRELRVCLSGCNSIGDRRNMILIEGGHHHGACFIKNYGMKRFLQLPREQLDKLPLNDIGHEVMLALLGKPKGKK